MDFAALLTLPDFIEFPLANASTLNPTDSHELERRGGLIIPPPVLRNVILRAFAESVYPQMPVVNLHRIVAAIDANGHPGVEQVNLLLFQAIMFAGISYVPLEHLQQFGYSSHINARRDFYNRVESCFNAYTNSDLSDSVVLIQSLLLMTLWYDPAEDQKDSHHWMRIVLALSEALGMHHPPDQADARDPATNRLWRRIAWTTYARDRMILLGARRPALISAAEFTLEPLSVNDFELEPIVSSGPSCLSYDCTLFRNVNQLQDMAKLCVEQIRLARCIDEVFAAQESLKTMSSPASFARALLACDSKLKAWRVRRLALDMMSMENSQQYFNQPNQHSNVVQRAVLHLTYYTVVSALHRPLVLRGTCHDDIGLSARLLESSTTVLNDATKEITQLSNYLYQHDLSLYLPASVVTSLLSALIVHIMSSKASDEELRRASLLGFEQCLHLLARLRSRHANAEDVYCFLERNVSSVREDAESDSFEVRELSNILEDVKRRDSDPEQTRPGVAPFTLDGPPGRWDAQDEGTVLKLFADHNTAIMDSPPMDVTFDSGDSVDFSSNFFDVDTLFADQSFLDSMDGSMMLDQEASQLIPQRG